MNYLRPVLEWQMEIENNWAIKPGALGKGLKKRLNPGIWSELERTYVGAGLEENWRALFDSLDLFRKVALAVGDHLGYEYPHHLDHRIRTYLQKVRHSGFE